MFWFFCIWPGSRIYFPMGNHIKMQTLQHAISAPSQSSFKSHFQFCPFSLLLAMLFSCTTPFPVMLHFVTWLCSQCFLCEKTPFSFMPMENIIPPLAQNLFLCETFPSSAGIINFYLICLPRSFMQTSTVAFIILKFKCSYLCL